MDELEQLRKERDEARQLAEGLMQGAGNSYTIRPRINAELEVLPGGWLLLRNVSEDYVQVSVGDASEQRFRKQVAAALEELRAEWLGEQIAEPQSVEESGINARIQRYVNDLDATIAALGLGGTETGK